MAPPPAVQKDDELSQDLIFYHLKLWNNGG